MISVERVTPPLPRERMDCCNQPHRNSQSLPLRLTPPRAHRGRPSLKTRTDHAKVRCTPRLVLVVLMLTTLLSPALVSAINRESETAALDGLLAIVEAQTRFAVRNGRYATNIADLGFQTSVGSPGQLTMRVAFDADWDNPQRAPASGYLFRVLAIGDGQGNSEPNSYWAAAIPAPDAKDLPLHFTAAHKIQTITFPLVGWWSVRVHGTNRLDIVRRFAGKSFPSLAEVGLAPETPEAFPDSTTLRRFLLESGRNYPEAVPIAVVPVSPPNYKLWVIGGSVIFLLLLLVLKPKRKQ